MRDDVRLLPVRSRGLANPLLGRPFLVDSHEVKSEHDHRLAVVDVARGELCTYLAQRQYLGLYEFSRFQSLSDRFEVVGAIVVCVEWESAASDSIIGL